MVENKIKNHTRKLNKFQKIIDDELKAIYNSKDTICIWVFKTREDRNKFMDDTVGMKKDDRQNYYDNFYK